ncbi:hypothetical protein NNO02_04810 [Citrobacter sp. Awk 2]|uniref:hypothetical protein n=1 Tax=unclassified Citrobacter TaxID=2644389 RepID=UPI0023040F18|nr:MULTISPECIES: hypothetical protein [unclassified Citrobacter]MDA8501768.1 hypothetical protein [Citrobacter sp. Awk 2]MDA8512700.1 hypothetical protein [Citrobacter sp. Igbk 14]
MNSGFFISRSDFQKMSERTQAEILSAVTGEDNSQHSEPDYSGLAADLSSLQATQFVKGLSGKSRNVLKAILEIKDVESGFWMKTLAVTLSVEADSLTGVWSGLTRRSRTVTGDANAYLIDWVWREQEEDYFGTLNAITIKNLKKAMNIR